ncbi:MAG: type II toxin-antitoxin system RelE/ParE family toxin [Xanthomonadales bacterium]|nr:type II toxin-antitoxin system RelE/ParE family toxin [Xanthomonadales bacterium]
MNFRFHRAALREHLDEVAFYEGRLHGLGADYLAEFEAIMVCVCASPDADPVVTPQAIRKARLKRFPFDVLFRVESAQVVILAIAHQRRRPNYWIGRAVK